jgi:hypothetical protein
VRRMPGVMEVFRRGVDIDRKNMLEKCLTIFIL